MEKDHRGTDHKEARSLVNTGNGGYALVSVTWPFAMVAGLMGGLVAGLVALIFGY